MSRKVIRTRDAVFEDRDDGFFYCIVAGTRFGPWRFREEAVAGLQVEQRREKQRRERLRWTDGEIQRALATATSERDQFRMRFVAKMATATLDELEVQYEAVSEQWREARTPEEQAELINGHTLVEAVMVYRFGKQPRARECRKFSRIAEARRKWGVEVAKEG